MTSDVTLRARTGLATLASLAAALWLAPAVADDAAAAADAAQPATAETYTYTWEELVELIPELREMQLVSSETGRRVREPGEIADGVKLCRREPMPGSLLSKRRCYTLDEYVEEYVQSRQLLADIMSGRLTQGMMGEGGGAAATGRTSRP